ncbi:unnamed protein product [Wickerhamomyces anomalus]
MSSIMLAATKKAVWKQVVVLPRIAAIPARSIFTSSSLYSKPSAITKSPIFLQAQRFQSSSAEKAAQVPEEVRKQLGQETPAKIYTYEEIKNLVTNPDPNKLLVDVREPSEVQEYAIPNSINIPYKSTPGALDLSPEEFEDVFKFEKPDKDKELIFYCVAGVRSTAAAELAQIFGYNHLGNYVGSLNDWKAHENIDLEHKDTISEKK